MESSSPGIEFQPRDYRGDPIHRSGNDNTSDRYTGRDGYPSTVTEYDQSTTTSLTRFVGTDLPGSGPCTETPPSHCIVGILGYISGTRSPSHRSHGCGGTRNQYGRPATHSLCTTTYVTPEDEKGGRMRGRVIVRGHLRLSW